MKIIIIFILLILVNEKCFGEKNTQEVTARALLNEVITQVKKPHAFDVRSSSFSLMLGQSYIHEGNNFESTAFQLGVSTPLSSGNLLRFWIRRVWVEETTSTKLLARTPFKQVAQSDRFEFHFDYAYSLMEGRNFTRLGPWVSDVEAGVYGVVGLHYNLAAIGWLPSLNEKPDPLPGQDPFNPSLVLDAGILWQAYFSSGFGLSFEMVYNLPFNGREELKRWKHFSWGLLWAFGE